MVSGDVDKQIRQWWSSCNLQVFAVPEAGIGFHTDCSFSYILSRLPGHLGKIVNILKLPLSNRYFF